MTNRRRKTKKNSRNCMHVRKKNKRKSTNATEQFMKRTNRNPSTSCEERVGATGPGKSGLECSRYHDKVHVSCVGKTHLQYFEGYDDSDDDDFEFLCTRCFCLDDNSSIDSESD